MSVETNAFHVSTFKLGNRVSTPVYLWLWLCLRHRLWCHPRPSLLSCGNGADFILL